jgi:hypothetical protein
MHFRHMAERQMPIRRLLDNNAFRSEEVKAITDAFEEVLRRLGLPRGTHPKREELIARKVFAVAKNGRADTNRIVEEAMRQMVK